MRYRIIAEWRRRQNHTVFKDNEDGSVAWVATFTYREDAEAYVKSKEESDRMDEEFQKAKDGAEPPFWDDPI